MEESDVRDRTRAFAADPERERALEAILDVDEERDDWTFGDVPIDSGNFGELISRGIVVETDDGYKLYDRKTVERIVRGAPDSNSGTSDGFPTKDEVSKLATEAWASLLKQIKDNRRVILLLTVAVALIVTVRSVFTYSSVFREGVVLPGNDPYRYRYWLNVVTAGSLDPFSIEGLRNLPNDLKQDDVLLFAVLWWAVALLGNSTEAVDVVLIWYPVLTAAASGVVVYLLAVRLTNDPRVGIVAALFLAVTPIHATYTTLGFGDHHAFDYLLLTLAAFALVMSTEQRSDRTGWRAAHTRSAWGWALALGGILAAQNAAWRGGPLLVAAVGVYAVARTLSDVRQSLSPVLGMAPIIAATMTATVITAALHYSLGWLPTYRLLAPAGLLFGILAVVSVGELGRRGDFSTAQTATGTVGAIGVVSIGLVKFVPSVNDTLSLAIAYFSRTGSSSITETSSLFAAEYGFIFGPLFYLGFQTALGVPVMAWALWVGFRDGRPKWLAASTFVWYLIGLAAVQMRFAGELSPLLAVFSAIGFLMLLSKIELVRPIDVFGGDSPCSDDRPAIKLSSPNKVVYVGLALILLVGYGPIGAAGYIDDVAVDDEAYETAKWIGEYSDERDLKYPENYVFSDWDDNRLYNYYASGEYRSYAYAQNNYDRFIATSAPDRLYETLVENDRAGFVVTTDIGREADPRSAYATLHERHGSAGDGASGVGHYRTVYVSESGDTAVHEAVPGARITGTSHPNETLIVKTEVEGVDTTYKRVVQTNRYGDWGITVPYEGAYRIDGNKRTVGERAVTNGDTVGTYASHWSFDEGTGDSTGNHVTNATTAIGNAQWVDGINGSAVNLEQRSEITVAKGEAAPIGNSSFTVSFWVKGDLQSGAQEYPTVLHKAGSGESAVGFWARERDFGLRVDDTNGASVRNFGINQTSFKKWTLVTAVLDRESDELRLYRNGTLSSTTDASSLGTVEADGRVAIGSRGGHQYSGVAVDSVRVYNASLSPDEIRSLSRSNRVESSG
jgi:dolichyl-diphosphooligosaccharide--protein glycosyltransferase